MTYSAPVDHIASALRSAGRLQDLAATGAFPNLDADLVGIILDEANKLARDVLAPLNSGGHTSGAALSPDGVAAPPGFAAAYAAFQEGGWMGLPFPEAWGGQGLPRVLAIAIMEMIQAANMSFALCPMLSLGAIEALLAHGDDAQKALYLPKLVSGAWTGAMNLTEPQAGSDVGALTTRATPNSDGSFALTGQKIYITWGDHDLAENIIHLVLARLPGAPAGSKGVSLFIAPKFIVNEDGSLGPRNALSCVGLERKIGLHGSPTCVMAFAGAQAWMLGAPNHGLAAMFTMMNSARLNVGIQGVAIAEAARQTALAYAHERKQGSVRGVEGPAAIVRHPDVRRALMGMSAEVDAARSICYACAAAADLAEHASDPLARAEAKRREDLLTPIAKAWSTDKAVEIASSGIQIHGGLGFMSETPASQYFLDARITPIYEGTNGIQAIDLVGRKLAADDGAAMSAMLVDVRAVARRARNANTARLVAVADRLEAGAAALDAATGWMISTLKQDRNLALGGASVYLRLAGDVLGGFFLAQAALDEADAASPVRDRALGLAHYYAEATLVGAPGLAAQVMSASTALVQGGDAVIGVA